uniref:Cell wall protein DAN4 n=1 Tax=Daphnia magna TaxID=35525 RepID=A0A0P6FM58_9CRUS
MATFNCVQFWLLLLVSSLSWLTISTAPMSDIDVTVDDPQRTGCLYDGKFYNETQAVHTKEPCLNCSCQTGALRCHLQVCPFLHDIYPPPAGCVLVERKNACCPKLHCPGAHSGGNRLFRKDPTGQVGAWKVREDLRKRLVKHLAKSGSDKQGCVDSGTLYADGSAMMTSSTCEYCFCLKGKQTCVKPRCAEPELEGCTPRFRDLACCPTHYDCATATANATSVVTKTMTPSERRGDRVRPMSGAAAANVRGNDRIFDSSSTTSSHHLKLANSRVFRKKRLTKRSADITATEATTSSQAQSEEPNAVTLGPDHLTQEDPQSNLEAISAASFFRKAIEESPNNDVQLDLIEGPHLDSLAIEGSLVESRVPAPMSITDVPEESATVATDDNVAPTGLTEAEDAPISDDLPVSSRLDEEPELIPDELDAEAAERNVEVSVSSSITSVSQSSARVVGKEEALKTNATAPPMAAPPPSSANLLPVVENKTAKPMADAGQVVPLVPPMLAEEEEPLDYDYSNMELPPSLPNLEIIPFVAADAVMGVPNLEEDERLNLGGVMEQRTPLSPASASESKTEHCSSGGDFYNHGELIKSQPGEVEDPCKICRCMLGDIVCHETQCAPLLPGCQRLDQPDFCCGQVVCGGNSGDRVEPLNDAINSTMASDKGQPQEKVQPSDEESKTTSTTQSSSPMLAFKVTFPPRPSSTLPPPPPTPSFLLRRFTSSRPTARPTMPTTPRSFNSKFSKPAINNLVGVPAPFATGISIQSINKTLVDRLPYA